MNKTTLIKLSFVFVTAVVSMAAGLPQKAYARETGTVPIIKAPKDLVIASTKDNSAIPIVVNPSTTDVTASDSPTPTDSTFTVTITVNQAPITDTVITLASTHSEAIGLPATVTVPAGQTSVDVTVSVTPGQFPHHKNVKISATANGTTVEGKIRVHYVGEQD